MESSRPGSLQPGEVFAGRYRIVRVLKEGGMGVVYEVRHVETDAVLAVKVMLPDKEANAALRERFRLEWRLTANILGEHVVRAFDAGLDEDSERPFLVMERLVGEDLGTRIAREGGLPWVDVIELLGQLARALARIHAAGVVHRDIRPANLFLSRRDDGSPLLKVLDFGIAKVVVETTRTLDPTLIVGSPPYMPPEQLAGDGDIGPAADLYAFAHVAFTLLVGSPYWEDEHRREGVGGLRRRLEEGLPELPSVRAEQRGVSLPPAFDDWFRRLTLIDPDERPASLAELTNGLARALGVAPSSPPRSLVTHASQARARALPVRFGGAALAALGAVAVFVLLGTAAPRRAPAAPRGSSSVEASSDEARAPPSLASGEATGPVGVPVRSSRHDLDPAAPASARPSASAPNRGSARPPKPPLRPPPVPAVSVHDTPPDPWGRGVQ